MKFISVLLIICLAWSCETKTEPNAQDIIDKAIAKAGGERYYNSKIEFNFRDRNYCAVRNDKDFKLERLSVSDSIVTTDILSNSYFMRVQNDKPVSLPDSTVTKLSNSVNSVHYFSVLPYGLNDEAANKNYLGEISIKGKTYHKIEVTFNEEGGGTDFDDVFVYWIDTTNYNVDYLAYEFHVNGGGMRFREAYNERLVNGIRFVDYKNYKPIVEVINVRSLDSLFETANLKLLSKIELEDVHVESCANC